jgi:hypothetical protein
MIEIFCSLIIYGVPRFRAKHEKKTMLTVRHYDGDNTTERLRSRTGRWRKSVLSYCNHRTVTIKLSYCHHRTVSFRTFRFQEKVMALTEHRSY